MRSSSAPGIGDAPYVSTSSEAIRSGAKSGWSRSIPIIVGTITERQLYVASGYRVYVLTIVGVDADVAQTVVESLRVP